MEISVPVHTAVAREPFMRLLRLLARTCYDNYTTVSDNHQKSAKTDSRGNTVVVLEALMRRQWVREEDLARDLKKNAKQVRKILRYLEEEKLVSRYQRKENAKRAKMYNVAVAATTHGRTEENVKYHTHSYCCLDYQQMYNIVRCKLDRIKIKLKNELEDKNTVQEYGCHNCKRKYSALDALRLISMEDDSFHCEKCNGELVVECNKLTSEDVVDGANNAKTRLRERLQIVEALMNQMNRVQNLPFPVYEPFLAWEARAARETGGLNPNDPSRSQGGYGSTPMPFLGETKVEVNLGDGKEDVKSEGGDSSMKQLPPWMIRQGMNLTDEQRGEMRQEAKVDGVSEGAVELLDDNKSSAMGNDDVKDEYLKAYYAELLKQQEIAEKTNQQESAGVLTPDIHSATTFSDRQVGMKSKREEEDEEGDHVSANGDYKEDLNAEGDEDEEEEEEEEEEDVEWEEG